MESNIKAQKAQEASVKNTKEVKRIKKLKSDGTEADAENDKTNFDEDGGEYKVDTNVVNDTGLGVFPYRDPKEERLVELPNIIDQEEIDQLMEKKRKQEDRLGLRIDPDHSKIEIDSSGKNCNFIS